LQDVEGACRGIAEDLGASEQELQTALNARGSARVTALCDLAIARFNASFGANGTFRSAGTLTLRATPPRCSASVSAKANCQAKCSVDGRCDLKANPPTCEGGRLEVACKGECTAKAGATLSCTGQCTGSCKGSCEAKGGVSVECDGQCDGTCSANANGSGNGMQADGTCKGFCSGKCTFRAEAPAVQCSGTCSGECSASCQGSAQAEVRCDGECKAEAEPISCTGGELKGGCEVNADCNANCNASVQAKAECTPPAIELAFSARAQLDANVAAQFSAAVASLERNLGTLVLQARARGEAYVKIGEAFGSASARIVADPGKLNVKGAACATKIAAVAVDAVGNARASLTASAKVVQSLNVRL
jgi:hypothetical protein